MVMKKGIMVAIVTFSGQSQLIGEVLRLQFPEQCDQILIRGNDRPPTWIYQGTSYTVGIYILTLI